MGEDHGIKEFLTSVDTVLIGRKTHDFMVQHGMPAYTGMKNFVFSRSKRAAVEGVEFVTGDVATLVKGIREKSGKDLWLVGGGELTREALASKALDEVIVGLIPVLLGKGIPLFPAGYPECKLELLHCQQLSKGVVQLSYRCRYS
jgi:dihydrofolate reductase